MDEPFKRIIVVMGAGIAGSLTALELAKRGYKVVLLDKREEILKGSSNHTPARLGLGYHYPDIETAIKYLRATIAFLKEHPDCLLSSSNIDKGQFDPIQHGRYFIMEPWDESKSHDEKLRMTRKENSEIYAVWEALKREYARLCEEDPSNKIFGEPNEFSRNMKPGEISDLQAKGIISKDIMAGIETAEGVLNWPKLREKIKREIENNGNITFIPQADIYLVTPILGGNSDDSPLAKSHAEERQSYQIAYKDKEGTSHIIAADAIANCSWESIDYFRQQLSAIKDNRELSHRLKIMIEVELPAILQEVNSMFFCFGPHASETNCGDGRGFVTYEPVTNYLQSGKLITPEMELFLYADSCDQDVLEKKKELALKILAGVQEYIPAIAGAKIKNVTSGIVRTVGDKVDIYSSTGEHHQRRESGVIEGVLNSKGMRSGGLGYGENASMKLIYGFENSQSIANMFDEMFPLRTEANKRVDEVVIKAIQHYKEKAAGKDNEVYLNSLQKFLKKTIMDIISQQYVTTSLKMVLTDGSLNEKLGTIKKELEQLMKKDIKKISIYLPGIVSSVFSDSPKTKTCAETFSHMLGFKKMIFGPMFADTKKRKNLQKELMNGKEKLSSPEKRRLG